MCIHDIFSPRNMLFSAHWTCVGFQEVVACVSFVLLRIRLQDIVIFQNHPSPPPQKSDGLALGKYHYFRQTHGGDRPISVANTISPLSSCPVCLVVFFYNDKGILEVFTTEAKKSNSSCGAEYIFWRLCENLEISSPSSFHYTLFFNITVFASSSGQTKNTNTRM